MVDVQRLDLYRLLRMTELPVNGVKQSPVARAPAVDALLDVADNQVLGVLMAHALFEQHLEVLPLDGAGILELVYHDVLQLGAYLLEDERRVVVFDERVEQLLRVAEQKPIGLIIQRSHLVFDAVQQA